MHINYERQKKRNSSSKSANVVNTMSSPLLSLKDIALGITDSDNNKQEESLSKSQDDIDDKSHSDMGSDSLKVADDIKGLLAKLAEISHDDLPTNRFVTIRINKKCHKILSELKLDDDFGEYRYGDILEALLYIFIEKNRAELKRKLSKRKSSF